MNIIHSTAVIYPNVEMGDGNVIHAYSVIGSPAEFYPEIGNKKVVIGNNNIFREFTTINSGCFSDTKIGSNNIFLRGSHVGHDSMIGDKCTISCNALIGGHSLLMDGVNLGLGSILHQFSRIGAYSMVGMGGVVPKNKVIDPCTIHVGNPIRFLKMNNVAIKRNNLTDEDIHNLTLTYKELW